MRASQLRSARADGSAASRLNSAEVPERGSPVRNHGWRICARPDLGMAPPRVDHAQARHEQPHELAPVARAPVLVERILLVGAHQHAQPIAMTGAEVREAGLRARLGQQLRFVERTPSSRPACAADRERARALTHLSNDP